MATDFDSISYDNDKFDEGVWYPNTFSRHVKFKSETEIEIMFDNGEIFKRKVEPNKPHFICKAVVAIRVVKYTKKKMKKTIERWANIYQDGVIHSSSIHRTYEMALHKRNSMGYIATIKLTGEYEVEE